MKNAITAGLVAFSFALVLHAAPPAPGIPATYMPKDRVHIGPETAKLIAQGAPSYALTKTISATGTKNIAVIFVSFSDAALTAPQVDAYTTSSTATPGYLKRMADYYAECSYGTSTLNTTFYTNAGTGWTLGHTMAYYSASNYTNVVNGTLFNDACVAAGITKATGPFDALLVVHAGNGAESVSTPTNEIWSMFTDSFSAAGFTEGETVPATEVSPLSPFGVLCHEFGHQLGLVDLYNTAGRVNPSNIGLWDIMDYGCWADNGKTPTQQSAWSKQLLGWISPVQVSSSTPLTLINYESVSNRVYRIPILGSSTEYFLVEFRKKIGSDLNLPGSGTVIYHIDDTVGTISTNNVNSLSPHLRVSLVEADNNSDIPTNHGDPGDPWADGSLFTSPRSDGYSGQSYMTVSNFTGTATNTVTANLAAIAATTALNITNFFNFPNPVKGAASTTIRLALSRPFTTAELRILTIAGDQLLDKTIDFSNFKTTLSDSTQTWIFDYVWDLKNSSGNLVSSGLYLCVITTNISGTTQSKTSKLVIVR